MADYFKYCCHASMIVLVMMTFLMMMLMMVASMMTMMMTEVIFSDRQLHFCRQDWTALTPLSILARQDWNICRRLLKKLKKDFPIILKSFPSIFHLFGWADQKVDFSTTKNYCQKSRRGPELLERTPKLNTRLVLLCLSRICVLYCFLLFWNPHLLLLCYYGTKNTSQLQAFALWELPVSSTCTC